MGKDSADEIAGSSRGLTKHAAGADAAAYNPLGNADEKAGTTVHYLRKFSPMDKAAVARDEHYKNVMASDAVYDPSRGGYPGEFNPDNPPSEDDMKIFRMRARLRDKMMQDPEYRVLEEAVANQQRKDALLYKANRATEDTAEGGRSRGGRGPSAGSGEAPGFGDGDESTDNIDGYLKLGAMQAGHGFSDAVKEQENVVRDLSNQAGSDAYDYDLKSAQGGPDAESSPISDDDPEGTAPSKEDLAEDHQATPQELIDDRLATLSAPAKQAQAAAQEPTEAKKLDALVHQSVVDWAKQQGLDYNDLFAHSAKGKAEAAEELAEGGVPDNEKVEPIHQPSPVRSYSNTSYSSPPPPVQKREDVAPPAPAADVRRRVDDEAKKEAEALRKKSSHGLAPNPTREQAGLPPRDRENKATTPYQNQGPTREQARPRSHGTPSPEADRMAEQVRQGNGPKFTPWSAEQEEKYSHRNDGPKRVLAGLEASQLLLDAGGGFGGPHSITPRRAEPIHPQTTSQNTAHYSTEPGIRAGQYVDAEGNKLPVWEKPTPKGASSSGGALKENPPAKTAPQPKVVLRAPEAETESPASKDKFSFRGAGERHTGQSDPSKTYDQMVMQELQDARANSNKLIEGGSRPFIRPGEKGYKPPTPQETEAIRRESEARVATKRMLNPNLRSKSSVKKAKGKTKE